MNEVDSIRTESEPKSITAFIGRVTTWVQDKTNPTPHIVEMIKTYLLPRHRPY